MASYVVNNIVSSNLVVKNGTVHVLNGGVANNTTVNFDGDMAIYSGGTANNTTVNSLGRVYVSSGGIANNTNVKSAGHMHISSGGTANSTTIHSSGAISISSGGTVNSITVSYRGSMYISSGGTATDIFVMSGGSLGLTVAPDTYIQGTSNGVAFEMKNAYIERYTVNFGNSMRIFPGGTASYITVNSGGFMYISSGGTATDIFVIAGGSLGLTVAPDTYIQGTSNGVAFEMKNAYIERYTVYTNGMYISSGGTANSITVNGAAGRMYIYAGGTANNTTVISSGYMFISSGGTANTTTVRYWGDMSISSGGIANNTTVNSMGSMCIYSGGTANSTTINSSGRMYISGGTANNIIVNSGGYMYISGGTALQIKENGGYVDVRNGANVTFVSNTINGLTLNTQITVHSNTIALSTTVNSKGIIYIFSEGTASSSIVNSSGYIVILSGGTASRTIVNSKGFTFIESGGTHRGTLQIESGAVVSAYEGSIIDFTVADRTKEDGYLINNLSLIQGAPTYTITVSENLAYGTYKLAQGASNFTGTISIGTENTTYGSITVNGADFVYNGVTYSLDQVNGNLTLFIGDTTPPEKPTAVADITEITGKNVTITATFSKDSAVKQYKINDGEWQDYTGAVTVSQNAIVYFRAADEAGNISDVTEYVVDNINKSATLDGSGMTHAEAVAAGYDLIVTTGGTYKSNFGHDGVEARIEGGTFSCTVSGGALTSSTNYKTWDDQENETNLTVTSGTFNKVVMGGDRVNYGNCEHVGDLHLTIEGGTFKSQIVGGMAYTAQSIHGQAILTGDVNMTLAGGTFKSRIYGGCISTANYSTRTAIEGNINIVVDSSENELIFEDNVYIVAGSYQSGTIDGNVQVTFTGLGKNLKMDADNLVWGGCSSDVYLINGDTRTFQSTISGSRTICFDDFTGEFNTGIRGFNIFTAENGSKLKILASNHLRDIEQWNLDWDTQLSGSFLNDFRGDTMNIDLTGWDQTATNLFDCAAVTFAGFESMKKVTLGGETAVYSEAISGYASTNYMLTLNDNQAMQLSMKTTIA